MGIAGLEAAEDTMKRFLRKICRTFGFRVQSGHACAEQLGKAVTFTERFREIVSDPLNLVIDRVPTAGYEDAEGNVILHNGNRVAVRGKHAYYREFSDILIVNRGVHEPLEEFCFQELLRRLEGGSPTMLELGAYWAHYSMWLKRQCPRARCIMVDCDDHNLAVGRHNFLLNGFEGSFLKGAIGGDGQTLEHFIEREGISRVDVLHADIQGAEVDMLEGGRCFLAAGGADYVFISTHSQGLHESVCRILSELGFRIEVTSAPDQHTTSSDGFVLATSTRVASLLTGFKPLGRVDIAKSRPAELLRYLAHVASLSGGSATVATMPNCPKP